MGQRLVVDRLALLALDVELGLDLEETRQKQVEKETVVDQLPKKLAGLGN
jgi:hypothetical protein